MYLFQKDHKLFFLLFIIAVANSCIPGLDNKSSLTDERVENYIEVYKKMRKSTPEILQGLNEGGDVNENGQGSYEAFEKIIKEGGLEDFADFVRLNAKIGTIFSIIQANRGMDQYEQLKGDSENMFDENIKLLEEQLKDPEIPEDTKQELRESIKEIKRGKQEFNESMGKNEKWANLVLENVQKLTNLVADEHDVEVVMRHETEIMEAYVGFPLPDYKIEIPK